MRSSRDLGLDLAICTLQGALGPSLRTMSVGGLAKCRKEVYFLDIRIFLLYDKKSKR